MDKTTNKTTKKAGAKVPAALAAAIKATAQTAFLSGDVWYFNEATAKKYFSSYKTITPKDI